MKLAIVIPWFGRELKGGAEQLAWGLAWRLAKRGHSLDVLTTCCRSHQDDWSTNHLPAGRADEPEGFSIHRFPVVKRDRAAFDLVAGKLQSITHESLKVGISPVSPEESSIFVNELIKSPALVSYIEEKQHAYDWFILLPYLYGPILQAVEILGSRAALQPCLHDEAYAYLPQVAAAFRHAGRLLYNSAGEEELALRLFGPGIWPRSTLVGAGVDQAEPAAAQDLSTSSEDAERFVLYLGRKDAGKNVPMLVRAFERFRAARPNSNLRLLLAGNGAIELNGSSDAVRDLGLVDEATKQRLLRECAALFQPSQNESFSRVIMEAWREGKPVAAHAACSATAVAVRRSGGGWLGETEADWAALFTEVDRASASESARLGGKGKAYATSLADWEAVLDRYEETLRLPTKLAPIKASGKNFTIDQYLPNCVYGDAISNHAIWIREQLRHLGYCSTIYACHVDPRVSDECEIFDPEKLSASDAAIYHHSIGSAITSHLEQFGKPKCLIYHNITPADFFLPYRPEFAAMVQQGRDQLSALARHFRTSLGVSAFNAAELKAVGFRAPGVLPIAVDPEKWNFPPDPETLERLQDGRTNLLFTGRIAPNKRQDDLVRVFERYLDFDPDARLILVGKVEEEDPYGQELDNLIDGLGLQDNIELPGSVNNSQLAAYYHAADLFWSMSEHEGFCVPLIEAMWFDVPILALASAAVPETLGNAGLMVTGKEDFETLAALVFLAVTDECLREKMKSVQRTRRLAFLPEKILPAVSALADELHHSHASALAPS